MINSICAVITSWQLHHNILELYLCYENDPMNRWKESFCFAQSCAYCQIVTNVSSLFRQTASSPLVDHSGNRHANQFCGLVDWNFELSINGMRFGYLRIYEKHFYSYNHHVHVIVWLKIIIFPGYKSIRHGCFLLNIRKCIFRFALQFVNCSVKSVLVILTIILIATVNSWLELLFVIFKNWSF